MGTNHNPNDVTRLLTDASLDDDDRAAMLLDVVYPQLRAMAQNRLRSERTDHTLSATALVHESYMKLVGDRVVPWANRRHFVKAAADAMRQILLDHAKARGRVKRGGSQRRVSLDAVDLALSEDSLSIVSLDEAFRRLETEEPDAADVVRYRFYAGLSIEETAQVMDVSTRTINRTWNFARAWLYRTLEQDAPTE